MTTDTTVRYEARGAARKLLEDRSPEVVISGAAGTGKSLAALTKLFLACLMTPRIRCLIARKTAVTLSSTTLVSFDKKVAAEALASRIVYWFGGSAREPAGYRFKNGSVIVVGGLDNATKIMSSEYDLIFVDEATELTLSDWEMLGTRLRNNILSFQQQIAACNPVAPSHWIKTRSDEGPLRMLTSVHQDNPAYFTEDGRETPLGTRYLAQLGALTGVRRLRLLSGIWAAAEGLVYENWDPAVHLVAPFTPPPDWQRWWSVDFGFTNPMVVQFWAEDNDGRLYLYRELYQSKQLVEDVAKECLSLVTDKDGVWTEPQPRSIICDHDAEDRATFEKHLGLPTVAAKKGKTSGIQAVDARLKLQGDGYPRLYIARNATVSRDPVLKELGKPTSTEDEIQGYVWDTRNGRATKEEPVKEDDHGMDALRYMVAERDMSRSSRVSFFRI